MSTAVATAITNVDSTVERAKPVGASTRNPVVDTVRVLAVAGVVGGHWLVTALVSGVNGLSVDSPLRFMPGLVPVSWFCQTLGLFFLTGGYAAAASYAARRGSVFAWWGRKLGALAVPVAVLLGCWAAVLFGLSARGLPQVTVSTLVYLITTPLWFLGVYLLMLAVTPLASWLDDRLGLAAALVPAALAVLVDFAVPAPWNQLNELFVWGAAWQFGLAWRRRSVPRGMAFGLLFGGIAAYALLVLVAHYPVSAVGVPGQLRSNLAPPSAATLALAAAQTGAVLLAVPLLTRISARPRVAALVRGVNARALPIFLLHQSSLAVVTLVAGAFGTLPGLHTTPDGPGWILARLLWLPVFALVLTVLLTLLIAALRPTRIRRFARKS
ncbi:acyltransferase [Solihabitans fulvus]|uniref:Acyltransferase n=1 Tax=Solihabitans fulvus TaxID=1892852 RepID=A0A5B2WS05_9PSEU|nr:acyltransferase family protein [Solihabitans fulvus]KAA2254305.1 acyltransferase [Solihabitans fulvus]